MEIINRQIPRDFNLYLISDDHEGTHLRYDKGFDRFKEKLLKDKIGYAIHLGDAIEAIAIDDKRYDLETTKQPIPLLQAKTVIENYKPIAHKFITWLIGNHEMKLWKFGDLAAYIASELNIPYGTYTCKVNFLDAKNKSMFKGFFTHGFNSINSRAYDPEQRQAYMLKKLKDILMHKAGDCVLMGMGHTHKLLLREPSHSLYLTDDGDSIKQHYTKAGEGDYISPDMRWYVNTGSFYKLYEKGKVSYAERFGYDPTELGYIKIEVREGKIEKVHRVVI